MHHVILSVCGVEEVQLETWALLDVTGWNEGS